MPMPFGDPIDLSGIPTAGGASGAPASGGQTSMFNTAAPAVTQAAQVFVGWKKKQQPGRSYGGAGKALDPEPDTHGVRVPEYKSIFQMLQAFDAFSTAEYQKFKNKLVAAGIISSDASAAYVRTKYETLLNDIMDAQAQGVSVTPFGFVNSLIKKNGIDPTKVPNKKDWDPTAAAAFQPSTTKTTSVYDMDGAQAEQLLTQTLQQALGRDPSKAEIEDFVDAVKSRALADPSTQVTQTRRGDRSGLADANTQVQVQTIGGKSYSTIQTVNDGFGQDDAALLAQKRAENAPDYASYQAVATYMPALLQALGSTV